MNATLNGMGSFSSGAPSKCWLQPDNRDMNETHSATFPVEPGTQDADRLAITQAASLLGKRGGRPKGSYGPLSRWLRHQIALGQKEGESCRNVFRALSIIEGGGTDEFFVSEETASECLYSLRADIYGQRVTWESFRKTWQRI